MTGQHGDLATGNGYLGEIVDLPGGFVGLALFNEHGWERRVVYVEADQVKVVKLAQERPQLIEARDREFADLTEAYAREQRQKDQGFGW